MRKARKKPVEIEFISYEELLEFWFEDHRENHHFGIKLSIGEKLKETGNGKNIKLLKDRITFRITTLEGYHDMTNKDVLIIGVQGEIYPCKIDIFEQTYEIIE